MLSWLLLCIIGKNSYIHIPWGTFNKRYSHRSLWFKTVLSGDFLFEYIAFQILHNTFRPLAAIAKFSTQPLLGVLPSVSILTNVWICDVCLTLIFLWCFVDSRVQVTRMSRNIIQSIKKKNLKSTLVEVRWIGSGIFWIQSNCYSITLFGSENEKGKIPEMKECLDIFRLTFIVDNII